MDSSTSRSSGLARNTSIGTGWPAGSARATSKQNDLRRMSNECAVDLAVLRDSSTRTVTSGSARHSVRIRPTMSAGISTGALTREPPCDGHSVEIELVALDVLHHDARFILFIGKQCPHVYRAEFGQPCALGL